MEKYKAIVRDLQAMRRASPGRLTLCLRFGSSRLTIAYGSEREMGAMNYNPRKAAQVIAYFALKTGQRSIELIKAIKLVYLGDRESIARWGEPILLEPRVALPLGPVNDLTYAYAKGEREDRDGWSAILEDRCENTLRLREGVTLEDLDELSEADIEALGDVWKRVGFMDPMALSMWTHKDGNVPEWQDPKGSSRPIPLARIMREVGLAEPDRSAVDIEQRRSLASIIGGD